MSTLLTVPGYESGGADGLLAPPTPIEGQAQGQGSIAVRAMRSMRSIARMKSWANLGSDKSEKEGNNDSLNAMTTLTKSTTTAATIKTKEKGKKSKDKEGKSKSKKDKEEKKVERISTSSFEAGALSVQGSPAPPATSINKKPSKLALGGLLPGTLRLGTVRPMGSRVSSTSSTGSRVGTPIIPEAAPGSSLYGLPNTRLSAIDPSTHLTMGPSGRPSSAYSLSSQGSSLRPASTASGISQLSRTSGMSASAFSTRSARSSSSSMVSVRWDEEGLAGVKETQRRERELMREERRNNPNAAGRESRRSAEGRRRTPIVEVFPEVRSASSAKRRSLESNAESERQPPILTFEEATTDGHGDGKSDIGSYAGTPVKRARPRPMSEQLLGKARPKAILDDADGKLVWFPIMQHLTHGDGLQVCCRSSMPLPMT